MSSFAGNCNDVCKMDNSTSGADLVRLMYMHLRWKKKPSDCEVLRSSTNLIYLATEISAEGSGMMGVEFLSPPRL